MSLQAWLTLTFWLCTACVAYTCVFYPVLLGLLARMFNRPVRRSVPVPKSVSIVLAAHNEAERIAGRLEELIGLLDHSGLTGEIIVVVNGSTDETVDLANSYGKRVRVLEFAEAVGKATALSAGAAVATSDILVFGDVRQRWAKDALCRLVDHFGDPQIGAVSGDLIIESSPGVLAGVALYWRFEKWMRTRESRLWSMVGATGAISAVRRQLFRPIPQGTILDDVYWPLQVALQGYRVYHDPETHAFDQLPTRTRDEFRRKVRTLSGNFQLAVRLPRALLPWVNPVWLQLFSHKLMRLVVPWALLGMLGLSAALPGPFFTTVFALQLGCYAVALTGLWPVVGQRWRVMGALGSFVVLNSAAWIAFWVWVSGRGAQSWSKAAYSSDVSRTFSRETPASAGAKPLTGLGRRTKLERI